MNATDYHEAVELSLMRRHMRYGPVQYAEDWNSMVAMAVIQGVKGEKEHLQRLMSSTWKRIMAYHANTGEMPWAEDGSDDGVLYHGEFGRQ